MSPQIMITITKRCMFRFQPQKREKLHFLKKDQRSRHHIFENTIIMFLPNYPDTSKLDDLKERVSTTWHPCHEWNRNAMITDLTRSNHRNPFPIPDKKPHGIGQIAIKKEMSSCFGYPTPVYTSRVVCMNNILPQ